MANGDDDHMSDLEALERHIRSFVRGNKRETSDELGGGMVAGLARGGLAGAAASAFVLPVVSRAGEAVADMVFGSDDDKNR